MKKKNKTPSALPKADAIHRFYTADGKISFVVARNPGQTGKWKTLPFRPVKDGAADGDKAWVAERPPGKLPLYRLDVLAARPKMKNERDVCLIVEGEKTADKAVRALEGQKGIPRMWVTTWHGGSSGFKSTDWTPIVNLPADTRIQILCDEDAAGYKCGHHLGSYIVGERLKAGIANARVMVMKPDGKGGGYDIADAAEEGDDLARRYYINASLSGDASNVTIITDGPVTPKPVHAQNTRLRAGNAGAHAPDGGDDIKFKKSDVTHIEEALLTTGVSMRHNLRTEGSEIIAPYRGDKPGEWRNANDADVAAIQNEIVRLGMKDGNGNPFALSPVMMRQAMDRLAIKSEVDLPLEWLKSLGEWDGNSRFSALATAMGVGANPTELDVEILKATLCSAVRRVFDWGCPVRGSLVLIGPQGCAKTAFCRWLFPRHLRKSSVRVIQSMNISPKDMHEQVAGSVIVEWAEMSGRAKADINRIKNLLTMINPAHRSAYGHFSYSRERNYIFVLTTNDDAPLPNDPSGNTRFMPLRLWENGWSHLTGSEREQETSKFETFMDDNRDQLWAEAIHLVNADGHRGQLPARLWDELAERNEGVRDVDLAFESILTDEIKDDRLHDWTMLNWALLVCSVHKFCDPKIESEETRDKQYEVMHDHAAPTKGDKTHQSYLVRRALENLGFTIRRTRKTGICHGKSRMFIFRSGSDAGGGDVKDPPPASNPSPEAVSPTTPESRAQRAHEVAKEIGMEDEFIEGGPGDAAGL